MSYRPYLAVHVVWRGASRRATGGADVDAASHAETLANAVYASLFQDPGEALSRGIGIPVHFRSVPDGDAAAPAPIDLDRAEHSVVVILVDDAMVLDPVYRAYALGICRDAQGRCPPHLVIPVALTDAAYNLGPEVARLNAVRLQRVAPADRPRELTTALVHELCRLLLAQAPAGAGETPVAAAPVKLFLSHAKRDGLPLAETLLGFVQRQIAAQPFFDARDIPPGADFELELAGNVERSAVVAVRTDAYATRPWCRREIMIAKRRGCAMVVVDAVEGGEERSFPYLGNTPTLRWGAGGPDRSREVVDLALRELLRVCHARGHLAALRSCGILPEGAALWPRPPELGFLDPARAEGLLVYPDPPLGAEELEIFSTWHPRQLFGTPTQVAAGVVGGELVLEDVVVGLSASDSPDLGRLGFGTAHLQHVFQELARQLLAAGATLAYGGGYRPGGFTRALVQLVRQHRGAGQPIAGQILNFLAWPDSLELTSADEAAIFPEIEVRRVPPPPEVAASMDIAHWHRLRELAAPRFADAEEGARLRLAWKQMPSEKLADPDTYAAVKSACRTAMRRAMNDRVHARVVLGGAVERHDGKHSGLAEEVCLALESGRPVYLLGGFGGAAARILDVLRGGAAPASFAGFGDRLAALGRALSAGGRPIEEALDNGLSADDNRTLFATAQIPLMITTVLKGLVARRRANAPPGPRSAGTIATSEVRR
jgi:hypothetical protein